MKRVKSRADELRAEYKRSDFKKLERAKYYERVRASSNVVVLDPEVAAVFPNSAAVNRALHSLVEAADGVSGAGSTRRPLMNTAQVTQNAAPQESDLLVPFESQNVPEEYREYYRAKRNNFFASIQNFPEMWKYYTFLDSIWVREFADLKIARDAARMFPLLLYFNAHAKMRVGIELAFSGCMSEARSILRDAIEFVAHAHTMLSDAELQKTWLNKNDGREALEAFKDAFERHKKGGVFKDLSELHKTWGMLSETGSHANLNAMCDRFVQLTSDHHVEFRLNYTGLEPRVWHMSLFSMLLACFTMEQTLFNDYDSRLKLDDELRRMRDGFERYKEQIRENLKVRYGLKPPGRIHVARPTIYRP